MTVLMAFWHSSAISIPNIFVIFSCIGAGTVLMDNMIECWLCHFHIASSWSCLCVHSSIFLSFGSGEIEVDLIISAYVFSALVTLVLILSYFCSSIVMLAWIFFRVSRTGLSLVATGLFSDSLYCLICSYASLMLVAIALNVALSIVISTFPASPASSWIFCSCCKALTINCSAVVMVAR